MGQQQSPRSPRKRTPAATPEQPPVDSTDSSDTSRSRTRGDTAIRFEPPPAGNSRAVPAQEPVRRDAAEAATTTPFLQQQLPIPGEPPRPPRQPSRASNAIQPEQAPPAGPATEAEPTPPAKKATAKKAATKAVRKAPAKAVQPPAVAPAKAATKAAAKKATKKTTTKAAPAEAAPKVPRKAAPRAKKTAAAVEQAPAISLERHPSRRHEPATPAIQLLRTLRAKPGFAPELLALAAVDHLGGEAQWQTRWLRETYPHASAERLSRLVAARFVRQAGYRGAVAGLAGPTAMLLEAASLAWLQGRLVLHVAAAYGHDPLDPARAAELLVLQRIHPTLEVARAALAASANPADEAEPAPARLAVQLGRLAGSGAVRATAARLASRILPGGAMLIGALTGARSTEQLALRANRYYRSR